MDIGVACIAFTIKTLMHEDDARRVPMFSTPASLLFPRAHARKAPTLLDHW
ncbi:hypothetical protein [Paraburkholderia sp. GAS334]|uniref:hypothetical protein n=1 Tax=Paraburkholderia sp. GAS334 TaxID=3035131 RepID=UPI003D1F4704